jgi:membrane protein implicated in regulation of membrane protease activity
MYLVPIAWMYVVLMMAAAEAISPQGTLLGAFFTALLYGVLPLSIVLYVMGTPGRRKNQKNQKNQNSTGSPNDPDGSSHAASDAVAAKREII